MDSAEYIRDTCTRAERALARAWGGAVRLAPGRPLTPRGNVCRCRVVAGPPGTPPSVIVKRARIRPGRRYEPDAAEYGDTAWLLCNDWAGLQFLTEVGGPLPPAPRFYAGDREAGLIVLEDLGTCATLDDLLAGDDPARAEAALIALAATLGRLHAATIGKQAVYERIRAALGPRPRHSPFAGYEWLAAVLHQTAATLDIRLPPGVAAELRALIAAIREPGPFLAYTHGDSCPGNCLCAGATVRVCDFELGAFRPALLDGICGRIHFPTCRSVTRVPPDIPPRMEAAYRAALAPGCPEAADDGYFYRAVVEACIYWALLRCQWSIPPAVLPDSAEEWGVAALQQIVLIRFDLAAQVTAQFGHLEALGATFAAMAATLRTRWPPAADAAPYHRAFRAGVAV
jgi:phosphotransferase family enzyme